MRTFSDRNRFTRRRLRHQRTASRRSTARRLDREVPSRRRIHFRRPIRFNDSHRSHPRPGVRRHYRRVLLRFRGGTDRPPALTSNVCRRETSIRHHHKSKHLRLRRRRLCCRGTLSPKVYTTHPLKTLLGAHCHHRATEDGVLALAPKLASPVCQVAPAAPVLRFLIRTINSIQFTILTKTWLPCSRWTSNRNTIARRHLPSVNSTTESFAQTKSRSETRDHRRSKMPTAAQRTPMQALPRRRVRQCRRKWKLKRGGYFPVLLRRGPERSRTCRADRSRMPTEFYTDPYLTLLPSPTVDPTLRPAVIHPRKKSGQLHLGRRRRRRHRFQASRHQIHSA